MIKTQLWPFLTWGTKKRALRADPIWQVLSDTFTNASQRSTWQLIHTSDYIYTTTCHLEWLQPWLFSREPWIRSCRAYQEWCYIDDILVVSATCEEHLKWVEEVLKRVESYGLRGKRNKCVLSGICGVSGSSDWCWGAACAFPQSIGNFIGSWTAERAAIITVIFGIDKLLQVYPKPLHSAPSTEQPTET